MKSFVLSVVLFGAVALAQQFDNTLYSRCFRTGCVPNGLPHNCGAGIVEVARDKCISGRYDVTCCVLKNSPPPAVIEPAYPVVIPAAPRISGDNHKGYWDDQHRCFWTGCAPKGLPAFCPAALKESGSKQCIDQGRIDVRCCP